VKKTKIIEGGLIQMNPGRIFFCVLVLALEVTMGNCGEVTTGPGGFLVKDGKPVFVLGAYAGPEGSDPKSIAALGFNLLHVDADPAQWDACQQAGLMTWHSFNLDFTETAAASQENVVRESVEKFKDHPALLFWESVDEPAWTHETPEVARALPEPLTRGYRYLKSLDARHPVYLNHAPRNTVETLRKYNLAADILCVDVYPVVHPGVGEMYAIIQPPFRGGIARQTDLPDTSPACIGDYVDKMRQVAYEGHPVFVVLQGFAWEGLRKKEERNADLIVYPSYQQLRFMAFQAIIHGVNGITVWGLNYADNDEYFSSLSAVLHEVHECESAILGGRVLDPPAIRYHERGYSIGKGIECLITETPEAVTLFSANASVDPARVQFSSLPRVFEHADSLEVVGENRSVDLQYGTFEEYFEGLGVHVYRYSR
jgi:hypothetical protein